MRMHPIQQYLETHGMDQEEFASAVGLRQAFLSQLISGVRKPSFDVIHIIALFTNNEIQPNHWFYKEFELL